MIPKLLIPTRSYEKIMAYTQAVEGEITGFADVDFKDGNFVVGEVYLLEQTAGAIEVDMDEEVLSTFMLGMISNGATQLPRLWWHSHVNMAAFFSGTDTDTISKFKNDSYTVSLVVNKQLQSKAQVNLWKPFEYEVNLEVQVLPAWETIPQEIIDEVGLKVKEKAYPVTVYKGSKKNENFLEEDEDQSIIENGIKIQFLPENYAEAKEFIDELARVDDLWVSWDRTFKKYTFYCRSEQSDYLDTNDMMQNYAKTIVKKQEKEFYGGD